MQQLLRLFRYTRPYRRRLLLGIVAVSASSLLGLTFPLIARDLFNTAFIDGVGSPMRLNIIAMLLLVIFSIQAAFNYLRVFHLSVVGEAVVADLRKALFSHIIYLPVLFFSTRKTGEITSRLTADIATVQNVVSQSLAQFANQFITLLGGVAFLFYLSGRLTLVMLSVVPAVIIAAAYFGRKLRRVSTAFQDQVARANANAQEAIVGVRVVQSFTAEKLETARYGQAVDQAFGLAQRRAKVRAVFVPSVILAVFISVIIVLWYGGQLVIRGQLMAGDLIAFLLLTLFVAGSIGTFTGLYSQFQEALGASQRIFELLDEPNALLQTGNVPDAVHTLKGNVTFDNVSFRYPERPEQPVLHAIDLQAQAGEVIALVGPSGAGKSSLVSLLPRFYEPSSGSIRIDGRDIRDFRLEDVRRAIGIVPQETQLFSGSIADNIRYGKPDADREALEQAAQAANAHTFISNFSQGYDTLVGERGIKLSGGQRQRIAIARALLKNPRILILDEATSALDSESEALVQEALELLMRGRTTFVIAHRLSTIRQANRILVLDQGRIVQEGNHETLIHQGGLYRELYEQQFKQQPLSAASS